MTTELTQTEQIEALKARIAELEAAAKPKKKKEAGPCWCGCGGTTKSRFVPGHDAKFHSDAKNVARGLLSEDDLAPLPHEEAAAEFERCVAAERPKWAAKEAEKAAAKAAKEAAKAKAKAEKEETEEAEVAAE